MKLSKKTLATILIGLASVIGIVSIFCFFGASMRYTVANPFPIPSMFQVMLGGELTYMGYTMEVETKTGMTILFVIEVIILLLAVILIVGNLSKKLKDKATICIAVIIAVLTLAAVIMSFCTLKIVAEGEEIPDVVKLGAGPISYSVLGIIGIISNVAGILVYKKAQ